MNIMIIGGTSGIGLALAGHYLRQGHAVAIGGRDLQRVDTSLARTYPKLRLYQFDIADQPALACALGNFAPDRLDMLIVTAGLYFNTRTHPLDAATTLRMLQTNVSGLSHAFELAAQKMLAQGSGQLVAVSSVAGLLQDYPGASLYSATKRTVLNLCHTYRVALAPFSIAVTAIVPGYVDTAKLRDLNGGDASHKRFILSEQQALDHIVDAISRRQAVRIFPWQMRWAIALLNLLPLSWLRRRQLVATGPKTGRA